MVQTATFALEPLEGNHSSLPQNMKLQMKQKLLFFSWLLLPSICAQAQTGYVGIGTNTPKAKLDIVSDTSGLLIPRYASLSLVNTSVLPIMSSSIHNGLMLYVDEADNRGFWYYNGTAFEKVGVTMPFASVSSNITLNSAHYTVKFIGASASSFTITLPSASSCNGRVYKIINAGSSVGPSGTLNISSYQDYNGSSISTIVKANAITVQSDGTNWHLIP